MVDYWPKAIRKGSSRESTCIWRGFPLAVVNTGSGSSNPTTDLVLDNTDPEVTTTGTWVVATNGTGYEGTDYLQHAPWDVTPGGELLDNISAGFSAVGVWTTAIEANGYEGQDYLVRSPTALSF